MKSMKNKQRGISFIGILFVIFQALFTLSEYPKQAIEDSFTWISVQLTEMLPMGMLRDLLINGIIAGIGGLVVFVPQIAFLFFFIAVLEETGYMSRVVAHLRIPGFRRHQRSHQPLRRC